MESYNFKARRRSGEIVAGVINADNPAAVNEYVRKQGLIVTQIAKANQKKVYFWSKWFQKSITLYDIAVFCRQFATLVAAGVSLISALDILIDQTSNPKFKEVISSVAREVHKGTSLSQAMNQFPKVFPELMINMIAAGETGGILETVLNRLATQYEKEYRLKAKIKSAMTYPIIVLIVAALAVAVILTFVMPIFTDLFKALNTTLPMPTRVVMAVSDFLKSAVGWGIIIVVSGISAIAYKQAIKHKEFLLWRDRFFLKVPVLGKLYNYIIITRFASTFAGLSRSGVPILQALEVTAKATGSLQTEKVLEEARSNVREGRGLAEPMTNSKMFPAMVVNMVSIGEDTGSLDFMLDKVAEFYGNEVEDMTNRLQTILEPVLIAILGVVVGFIAVAMLLPMFDIVTQVGKL